RFPETPAPQPGADMIEASKQLFQMQQDWLKQVWGWTWGMPAGAGEAKEAPVASNDRRFASEAWTGDPRFDALRRTYETVSGYMQGAVEKGPIDEKAKGQLRFNVRQLVDAMSPSNFLATTPDAMQLAVETGGKSIQEGASLFLQDLAKGRISTTDESAFEV